MGLSALDCPLCSQWDSDGEFPSYHGIRHIEMPDGTIHYGICDKCYSKLLKKGGKPFYYKTELVKTYGKDPKVEYGSKPFKCDFKGCEYTVRHDPLIHKINITKEVNINE